MKNKIIAHLSIILILLGVFFNGYTSCNRLSFYDSSVYAEADNWSSCETSDLVTAFRYYCKSRNLAIEGSIADAITSFTTTTFNNLCSTLGIDPTSLSAELKKTTQGNLGLRFLFSQTGITAYNRIFAEFLQNNDLAVGDSVDDKTIYSGEVFKDADGYSTFIWDMPSLSNNSSTSSKPISYGSKYKYDYLDLLQFGENSFPLTLTFNVYSNSTLTPTLYFRKTHYDGSFNETIKNNINFNSNYAYIVDNVFGEYINDVLIDGKFILYRVNGGSTIYFGKYTNFSNLNRFPAETWNYISSLNISESDIDDSNIYITTNNNTINNNSYNNNFTIIYNDGDTYISDDDDEPLPTTPPSGGGGGGGGDNPDNPDFPPVDPTPTPPPKIPDWDIELPEMPTGNDWLLYGLEKKFPWDIPFNLMYMLSLFAADPETPHFEGTLDLKIVQWNYDIDLSPFDDIAEIVRNFEFIMFLLGLMLLTRKLIWG